MGLYRLFFAALLVALNIAAQAPSASDKGSTSALDKATMEQYIRHLFAWGPQITVKVSDPVASSQLPGFREVTVLATAGAASQEDKFLVSADGQKIIRGLVYDVGENPFAAEAGKLRTEHQPSFGPADAPVTLVMYSDFQCSFCKEEAKVIRQNITASYPKQVRVYFKDFPLEAIHPWAKAAAVGGRCIFAQKPAEFWAYHDWIFENQAQVNAENYPAKLLEFVKLRGLAAEPLTACTANRTATAEIERSIAEGRELNVNSTPTMFINGRRVVGQVPWQQIKSLIDHEIEYANAHGASEKCCEVKVPSALNQ